MSLRRVFPSVIAVLAVAVLSLSSVATNPAQAQTNDLPEAVKHMLVQSITMEGGQHLVATVKMAIAAVPEHEDEIRQLIVLYAPNRVGDVRLALDGPTDGAPAVAAPAADQTPKATAADTAEGAAPLKSVEEPVGFFSLRKFTGKLELGGAVNTGNTEDESLALALGLNRKDGPWTYDLKTAFDIQRTDSVTTQQRFVIDTAVDYDITQRLYAFAVAEYEDDEFSGFNYRITSGGGVGYRVLMRPHLTWSVEGGPGARIDSFEDSGNVRVTPAMRAFSEFAWQFSEFAEFLHEVETIRDGGLTVDTTAAIVARITQRISGQLSYQFRYNSDAPVGNEEIDTTTRLSLVYDF